MSVPGCSDHARRPLLVVNPCPRSYAVALFDMLVGGTEKARFTAAPGVNRVVQIPATDATAAWSVELQMPGGAVRTPFEGWFDDGTMVIPALSCRPEDLRG